MHGRTTTAARFSFRAPIATEEERALFQRRLAMTAAFVFLLAFGFYVVQLVTAFAIAMDHVPNLVTHPSGIIHLVTTRCERSTTRSSRRRLSEIPARYAWQGLTDVDARGGGRRAPQLQ